MMLTSQVETEEVKEMAANPVKEPYFGPMATLPLTQQKEYRAPPVVARWVSIINFHAILVARYSHTDHLQVVAFAGSGKLISRSFNVAMEGIVMRRMPNADKVDEPARSQG